MRVTARQPLMAGRYEEENTSECLMYAVALLAWRSRSSVPPNKRLKLGGGDRFSGSVSCAGAHVVRLDVGSTKNGEGRTFPFHVLETWRRVSARPVASPERRG